MKGPRVDAWLVRMKECECVAPPRSSLRAHLGKVSMRSSTDHSDKSGAPHDPDQSSGSIRSNFCLPTER